MIDKIKYRIRILHALRPFSYGVNRFLVWNLFVSLLTMGLGFIKPIFYKIFIEDAVLAHRFETMPLIISGYLAVFILNLLLSYVTNYNTNRWVNRVSFRVKMKILQGFFLRDFTYYDTQSVGDMKMRLDDDTSCINDYAAAQTTDYVIAYIKLAISVWLLFLMEWRLAVFSCASIPLSFWLDHIIAKREAIVQNELRENEQRMSSWLHASVQSWREIKSLNLQKHEELRFTRFIHKYAVLNGIWINYWVARALIIPKIKEEFLMQFSLYFLGGMFIISGSFEIGTLLVFMQYYGILSDAVKTVSRTDAELLMTMPHSDRMLTELEMNYEKKTGCILSGDNKGSLIEFRNVSFSYPGTDSPVINNLSFSINKGERVALAGKSGAGKTTILKLVMGMLQPSEGNVLFSGMCLPMLSLENMHRRFGFVMQENMLFNATIRENLLYGKDAATNEELEVACAKAFILDFINSLPDGMETIIGERGVKLSGGQKQRIVLARLFLRDVDIYIFDEATSALDQYSESIVYDAINAIGVDKTIVIAAHRESSLSVCGRVIEL